MAARERRREQAQLNRSRAGARRALKGLRFISRTTGSVEVVELWRRVEERSNDLVREGLLSRDDFGECIGTSCYRSCLATIAREGLLSHDEAGVPKRAAQRKLGGFLQMYFEFKVK